MKLALTTKFYALSLFAAAVFWILLSLCQIEFVNIIFFMTAYIWHFALLTPGLKEQVMTKHHKLSFLSIIVRGNHYLQVFINLKRLPYSSSFIRTISPVLFTFLLFLLGGTGSILFTLLGSLCFEVIYLVIKKKTKIYDVPEFNPLAHINDLNIPPAIPNEEKSRE